MFKRFCAHIDEMFKCTSVIFKRTLELLRNFLHPMDRSEARLIKPVHIHLFLKEE
jgi:hypothetical protein